jgi:hypothetical protein
MGEVGERSAPDGQGVRGKALHGIITPNRRPRPSHLITLCSPGQGAGTAVDFGLKVVTGMVGKEKADEVSKAICHGAPSA